MDKFSEGSDYFGGAVLADRECGSVSLRDAAGSAFSVNVSNDPEYTLSGVYEPCMASERW